MYAFKQIFQKYAVKTMRTKNNETIYFYHDIVRLNLDQIKRKYYKENP